jgi:hypothetical protein
MSSGPNIAAGIIRMLGAQQRFLRTGLPVYYRFMNHAIPANDRAAQMGFPVKSSQGGWTDIRLVPQPSVAPLSTTDIGQSAGKLRFGALTFSIVGDVVIKLQEILQLATPDEVWTNPRIVGLVYGKKMFSIEDIKHDEVSCTTFAWILTCNSNDLQ